MMETDKPSVINKNCHIRFSCLWNDDIVSISASLNIPGFNIFSWPQPFQPKRSKDPNRRICAISAPVIINHFVLVTMTWLFHLLFNIGFTLFDDSFLLVTPNPMFFISCQNSKQNQSYRVSNCTDKSQTKEIKQTSLCAPIQQFTRADCARCRGDVTAYSVRTDFYVFCFLNFRH